MAVFAENGSFRPKNCYGRNFGYGRISAFLKLSLTVSVFRKKFPFGHTLARGTAIRVGRFFASSEGWNLRPAARNGMHTVRWVEEIIPGGLQPTHRDTTEGSCHYVLDCLSRSDRLKTELCQSQNGNLLPYLCEFAV